MYCYKCGEKIPDESVFCLKCGAKMPDFNDEANSNNTQNTKKAKNKTTTSSKENKPPTSTSSENGKVTNQKSEKKSVKQSPKKTENIQEKNAEYLEGLVEKRNWPEVKNEKGDLASYSISGKKILIDEFNKPIISIFKQLADQAEARQRAFDNMYKKKVNSTADMLEIAMPYLQKDIDIGIMFGMRLLKENGVDDIDKENFTAYLETRYDEDDDEYYYGDSIYLTISNVARSIDILSEQAQRNQSYRDQGKYNSSGGGWIGGGFGIKGAIKGALIAGALNMAGDALSSVSRQVATYGSDKRIREKMIDLYKREHESFYSAYEDFYLDDIFKKVVSILADKKIVKWRPYKEKDNDRPIDILVKDIYCARNYANLHMKLSSVEDKHRLKEMATFVGIEHFFVQSINELEKYSIERILNSDSSDSKKLEELKKIQEGNPASGALIHIEKLSNSVLQSKRESLIASINSVNNMKDWYKEGAIEKAIQKLNPSSYEEFPDILESYKKCVDLAEKIKPTIVNNMFIKQILPALEKCGSKGLYLYSLEDLEGKHRSDFNSLFHVADSEEYPVLLIRNTIPFGISTKSFYYNSSNTVKFGMGDIRSIEYQVMGVVMEEYFLSFFIHGRESRGYTQHSYDAYHSFKPVVAELNRIARSEGEKQKASKDLLDLLSVDRISAREFSGLNAIEEIKRINEAFRKENLIKNGKIDLNADSLAGCPEKTVQERYDSVMEKLNSYALRCGGIHFSNIEEAKKYYSIIERFSEPLSKYASKDKAYETAKQIIDYSDYVPALLSVANVYKTIDDERFNDYKEKLNEKIIRLRDKLGTFEGQFEAVFLHLIDTPKHLNLEMSSEMHVKNLDVELKNQHVLCYMTCTMGGEKYDALILTDKEFHVKMLNHHSWDRISVKDVSSVDYKKGMMTETINIKTKSSSRYTVDIKHNENAVSIQFGTTSFNLYNILSMIFANDIKKNSNSDKLIRSINEYLRSAEINAEEYIRGIEEKRKAKNVANETVVPDKTDVDNADEINEKNRLNVDDKASTKTVGEGNVEILRVDEKESTDSKQPVNDESNRIECIKCKKMIKKNSLFCPFCGEKVTIRIPCKYCGKSIIQEAKFCNFCGKTQ